MLKRSIQSKTEESDNNGVREVARSEWEQMQFRVLKLGSGIQVY